MKKIFLLSIISLALIQCAKKADPFLIQKDKIGLLERAYTLKQVDSVFVNDSVVKPTTINKFSGKKDDIRIYEKGGKLLLSLSPSEDSKVNIVTIHDERFKTDKGVGLKSTFKDFTTHYKVSKIDKIYKNINVEFKNQDFYITIHIDELPSAFKFDLSQTIEEVNIPDGAKIKSLRLDWF